MTKIKAVAFDIGHVVLDADLDKQIKVMGIQEPWQTIAQWQVHWDFETGKITTDNFCEAIRERFQLSKTNEEILKSWKAIILGFIAGMEEVLGALSKKVPIVAITNTNAPHFEIFHTLPAFKNFQHIFASHLLGHRKPTKEIFSHVLGTLGIQANELLFFDDLPENVEAAKKIGIHAYQVYRSANAVKEILKNFNLE
jgi:HAD superfamily hydrolase (TIGR01509 family)